ncbi:MAG: OmpH family outer membrane protein [Bacteroidales bacterium]|nr:OmpH family outer membrane protein [Bacteroidales bacterium]
MRKLVSILLFVVLALPTWAQKYASVNTTYIMSNVPEYNQALSKVNKYVEEWRKELEAKQAEVDELREQYQQESYLLPENLKQRRKEEIRTKEAELRALQQQRFAPGGDLDQKRAELLKPVQDRVYNAIERVAREKNYAFVFDRAGSATVLYVADRYDISVQVLELLGVKPTSNPDNGGINPNAKQQSPQVDPKTRQGSTSNDMKKEPMKM